jgi:hypothetical protein
MNALSRDGATIRISKERWAHVASQHPEMADQQEQVVATVSDPDRLQAGDTGEILAIRWYERTPLTSKFLVVAYRETDSRDGFVLTAYLTSRLSGTRTTIWTR